MFGDFEKARKSANEKAEQARLMNDPGVTPEVGKVYTISPDFVCGDRSYTDGFLEVLAKTENSTLVKIYGGVTFKPSDPRLLTTDDRYWYDATEAYKAYLEHRNSE